MTRVLPGPTAAADSGKVTPLSTSPTQSDRLASDPQTGHPSEGNARSSEGNVHPSDSIAHAPKVIGGLPINAFQRLLRSWDLIHPYNAAQVMELRQPVDVPAASAAWGQTLEACGLGRVVAGRWHYQHIGLNGEMARYPVRQLTVGSSLEAHLSGELNRPFDDPSEPPFRPFVLPDPAASTWHFGVVYQHWVADSVAVRLLLQRWVHRMFAGFYADGQADSDPAVDLARFGYFSTADATAHRPATRPGPVRHADTGYIGLASLSPNDEAAEPTLLTLIRRHLRYRRCRKVVTHGDRDYPVAVALGEAAGMVPRLVAAARRRGVRVNDLFLSAAARAADGRVPTQTRQNRPDLAVGSIVDLRPLARGALDDRFGLFLGFSEVVCRPHELTSPAKLVATVARQNLLNRRRGVWPSSIGWLIAALATKPFVPAKRLYGFVRKETPIVAGVSNVNLNRTWVAAEQPGLIARYRRISPTGPLAPIVFAATSLGDDLHLSLTYRSALLTDAQAHELTTAFLAELNALCGAE